MKTYQMFIYCMVISAFVNCQSLSKIRYSEAYTAIQNDFLSKKNSIEKFGKDISGVYIYSSIYPNPLDKEDYTNVYKDILSDKFEVKPLRKDKDFKQLSNKYLNSNWNLNTNFNTVWGNVVQYTDVPNGPLNAAVFSEIKDDQLRVDIVPFFVGSPKYCGSITKYYFKFAKTEIIESKKWTDHYECW
ncbi:hypothetical protein [Chryseobacterium sp. MEBOG07]|uniref:hypothetical protein n=1 Tax=Chryseobacterium sp. MEBOG07 TaxID=2879939 RepID=UPI001F2905B9|nr:hypothetical protein [Chryseobacterium sp. MEBOG07]UKB81363.1 hypothetical protein LF886_10330 [Chryseobacterium sp. MEBOG07]